MVRPDFTVEQFESLFEYVNSLSIMIPLFTILTPLPGTQLYKAYKDKLLTTDHRLFDLLHAVLPTRLPREEFYKQFARCYGAAEASAYKATLRFGKSRPGFAWKVRGGLLWFYARTWRYLRIQRDHRSFMRDEEGLLNGPGAKAGLTWQDVAYPTGDEHERGDERAQSDGPKLVKLRIPRHTWADEMKARANEGAAE
jgi:hypothetical protein